MYVAPLALYLLLCLLVAWRGRNSRIGIFGMLLLSIVITPVLAFLGLLLLEPPAHAK